MGHLRSSRAWESEPPIREASAPDRLCCVRLFACARVAKKVSFGSTRFILSVFKGTARGCVRRLIIQELLFSLKPFQEKKKKKVAAWVSGFPGMRALTGLP